VEDELMRALARVCPGCVLAYALASVGPAAAETRPRYGGNVEATLLGAPVSLDPVAARSHAESTVVELIFDTLYRVGADGVAQPQLAAGPPTFDEKGTTAHIELRKGIKFHDGTALTAQDVAASLERVRLQLRWLAPVIASARADGDALELGLVAPTDNLLVLLSLPQLSITKSGKPPGPKAIGSGPFEVDQLDLAHHRLELKAFDDHFAGRPYIDRLELRWYDTPDGEARRFETGNAHMSARGVSAFAGGQPTFRAEDVEGPAALLVYVGFGSTHAPVTRDPGFRRALDLALARGGLSTIGSGERVVPTRAPVPVEAGAQPLDSAGKTGDLTAARAELAASSKRVAELTPTRLATLRLEILVEDTRPDDREIAERVGLALDKLGITWVISAVPAATLRDRVAKGQCDLYIGQLAEPVTAATIWWAAAFAAGGDDWPTTSGAHQTGPIDPAAATKAFADREPIVPLMFRALRLWHRSDVRGLAFDATGRPCFADLFLFGSPTPTKVRP
jgi:ABC-type transport system substrate-binding protein